MSSLGTCLGTSNHALSTGNGADNSQRGFYLRSTVDDDYKIIKEMRQKRHKKWHKENRKVIDASGIPYQDRPEAMLFREWHRPQVDFYPSTGRWRSYGETHSGGAAKFLEWYLK